LNVGGYFVTPGPYSAVPVSYWAQWAHTGALPGDHDCDDDVDADDFLAFADFLAGPNLTYPAGGLKADMDFDNDVDAPDFGLFQQSFAAILDCNTNGTADAQDISGGTSPDCNSNGIPDECDIVSGSSEDCNGNGVPDECELATGASQDCNMNDVPDECDIASGASLDLDDDDIPDECEPIYFTLTGFEGYIDGTEVMFQNPRFSGSTQSFLALTPDFRGVSSETAFAGVKSYKVEWQYVSSSQNNWMRLTTGYADNQPNPTIQLDKPVRVRIRLDSGLLRVTLGIRETGTSAPLGGDGGMTGAIEWVGAASKIGSAPQGKLLTGIPGVWQTLVFDPAVDPILSFNMGDGILSSPTGKGTLEHLAFSSTGGAGPFTIYLDDVELLGD
jgi:hypothetical protein